MSVWATPARRSSVVLLVSAMGNIPAMREYTPEQESFRDDAVAVINAGAIVIAVAGTWTRPIFMGIIALLVAVIGYFMAPTLARRAHHRRLPDHALRDPRDVALAGHAHHLSSLTPGGWIGRPLTTCPRPPAW